MDLGPPSPQMHNACLVVAKQMHMGGLWLSEHKNFFSITRNTASLQNLELSVAYSFCH